MSQIDSLQSRVDALTDIASGLRWHVIHCDQYWKKHGDFVDQVNATLADLQSQIDWIKANCCKKPKVTK